ncbi:short chain dehydrogenase [Colletotrichum tamarilloi]|uniref:Short chain dehydrogenase n=1 Tax=Colletotrichum tamarilloi TaxID=1209934 RepID=A0ABQ9RG16_9PEZI|nr:short chain dehydrogenase [Colletotrichum tamarilloi]KAI3550274.1 short chain dehydrogenase [Colletotrichum filicis]KAK1502530.1 short chain dehydrogenase [Colletotrichum tamarilloi]
MILQQQRSIWKENEALIDECMSALREIEMKMTLFSGVAVVTGAASGIGRQVAISFAREGCKRIALLDRDEDGALETARMCREANGETRTFVMEIDNRNDEDIASCMENVVEEWGRIDYAVNCAGMFGPKAPSHLLTPAEFDEITNINYRGTWLCSRAELTHMIKQESMKTHDGRPGNRGVIVNVASNLSLVSRPETPAYNASKAAILSMTRSDAIDYAKYNIRVNCVCPGIIDTPMTSEVSSDDPMIAVAPMKRKGTPQEVADAVLFLCSSKASFIHGASLSVDGGYVIN